MNAVARYPLARPGTTAVVVPAGSAMLSAGLDGPELVAWFAVTDDGAPCQHLVHVVATGDEVPAGTYVTTTTVSRYTWHVFVESRGLVGATAPGS